MRAASLLSGVRVLEVDGGVAAAFAGSLLRRSGAEVTVLAPPESAVRDSWAAPLRLYLDHGKQQVTAGAWTPADILRQATGADVVLLPMHAAQLHALGVSREGLLQASPRAIWCSVTPYGFSGSRSGWLATDLTSYASGGQMWLTGDPDREPLLAAGRQAAFQGGLQAFAAISAALTGRELHGGGEWIDVSAQEAQALGLEGAGPGALATGAESQRLGNLVVSLIGIYPASDGWVSLSAMQRQVSTILRCIGQDALVGAGLFDTVEERRGNDGHLMALIAEWTSAHTVADILAEAAAFGAPFVPILELDDVLASEDLQAAGLWETATCDGDVRLPATPITVRDVTPAPAPVRDLPRRNPASLKAPRPLEGMRVLDLTAVWAGPVACRALADAGAEVIKVEGPASPDPTRFLQRNREDTPWDGVPYYNEYNRNKLGIALDLAGEHGREAFLRLAANADAVVENWRFGVADRLGVGYEALRAANPGIVMVSMPGFSDRGADAKRPGYGLLIESMAGLVSQQRYEGGPPHKSGVSYGDPIAGATATAAVAMGLFRRLRTGEGSHLVVSQRDAVIGMIGDLFAAHQSQPAQGAGLAMGYRETLPGRRADGTQGEGWLTIDAAPGPQIDALRAIVDAGGNLSVAVTAWLSGRDVDQAAEQMQAAGIPASPVLSAAMLVQDEHLLSRGYILATYRADLGTVRTVGDAWHLHRAGPNACFAAPRFGEHTAEVLARVGGYTPAEVEELRELGAWGTTPRQE
jgi:crotonobetainyl-CoA:carnitine CoA-transferase CaiB-like acyl-CoA transferase